MTRLQKLKHKYYITKSKIFRFLTVTFQGISKRAYVKAYHLYKDKNGK